MECSNSRLGGIAPLLATALAMVLATSSVGAAAHLATRSSTSRNQLSNSSVDFTAQHNQSKDVAVSAVFLAQPRDTDVSAVINSDRGVLVQLRANTSRLLGGQKVTMSLGANPPGTGTLSGTLTRTTNILGIARFDDLKIDWLGSGYTLVATANPRSGTVSATSAPFNELRVGDECLGPDKPACQGTCADSDGDGLSDAWENAGGVDLNGDGLITDSAHDLLLPGADPNKPDIFVHYDWMDYGGLDYQCSVDSDCPQNGNSPIGTATCTGPPVPGSAKSCVQSCNTDTDCEALGEAHGSDRCIANVCKHAHDPEALIAGAMDAVAARFASHGINLHIERGRALPHSHVVSFRLLDDPQDPGNVMTDQCEGGSAASGTAGQGEYAESYYDLKSKFFDPKESSAYHYLIFGHYSGCDTAEHCANDGHTGACPDKANRCATVAHQQSGYSEINGNDVIVSLGSRINDGEAFLTDPAPGGSPNGLFIIGGAFMHELGHNLGLRHGGGVSETDDPNTCYPPDCEDECTVPTEPNYKPNYLSVMNYRYQFGGIQSASAPGEFTPVDTRLDYSTQILPTVPVSDGVPGVLDEVGLDETQPNGLTSGTSDLFAFTDGRCTSHSAWPTHGPVDWDGDGVAGDNSAAMADLNPQSNSPQGCGQMVDLHRGHIDWGPAPGQSIFRYGFQCTQYFADPSSNSRGSRGAYAGSRIIPEIASGVASSGELTSDMISPVSLNRFAPLTQSLDGAVSAVFLAQPRDANVSAVINSGHGVLVQLRANSARLLGNQKVTMSLGTNPPGAGTLSGTLTRSTDIVGIARFNDLKIDWLGAGYTLVATANPNGEQVSVTSAAFDELRVGDACLGPDTPACSSGCADTDHDGLNDAWEKAGGIDLNGDGLITDSVHDVLLPGADPNVPDIYLKYDYMVASDHTHKPPDNAWDQMRAMFAAHGIVLHVLAPAGGIAHHQVTTLDRDAQPNCAGTDFITMQQLRAENFGNLRPAYHYMVFAHDSTTPGDGSLRQNCPIDPLCGGQPLATAIGIADLPGDDTIISFGHNVDSHAQIGIELWASTMMHELGHNFGLMHGSLADPGNAVQECMNYKPNYISVMNYDYEQNTLVPATAPGGVTPIACSSDADCGPPHLASGRCATPDSCFCTDDLGAGNNVCYRPDYAEDDLLNLNETTLDENVGVGGPSSLEDIVRYYYDGGTCRGPSNGIAIDWNNDGAITNLTGCTVGPGSNQCPDINNDLIHSDQMDTTADWTQMNGQFIHFNFQFQCTPGYQNDVPGNPVVTTQRRRQPSSLSYKLEEIDMQRAGPQRRMRPPRAVSFGAAGTVGPMCNP